MLNSEASEASEAEEQYSQSVLIVDDVSTVRSFLRQTLSHLGVRNVREAASGGECVRLFKEEQADIVFLDIELPDFDGNEVLRQLHEVNPRVNVVMISAHSTVDNVKESIENGAKGFIVKPFSPKKIAAVLKKFE